MSSVPLHRNQTYAATRCTGRSHIVLPALVLQFIDIPSCSIHTPLQLTPIAAAPLLRFHPQLHTPLHGLPPRPCPHRAAAASCRRLHLLPCGHGLHSTACSQRTRPHGSRTSPAEVRRSSSSSAGHTARLYAGASGSVVGACRLCEGAAGGAERGCDAAHTAGGQPGVDAAVSAASLLDTLQHCFGTVHLAGLCKQHILQEDSQERTPL